MTDEIKVHVVDFGRTNLYLRYVDPLTGRQVTKSARTSKQADAKKAAGVWEDQLRNGTYKPKSRVTWKEFRERYESEALPGLATTTAEKVFATFNTVEQYISPDRLQAMNADRVSKWQQALRDNGRAESTIKSYSGHLKAALNWAKDVGLLVDVPTIRMPPRAKGGKVMKGRPITTEEFERMLEAVPKVVGERRAASWAFLLRGLWLSGLRISEALTLSWDGSELAVDLTGRRPMLRISAEHEKGHKDRLLPLAPEAAELLLSIPEDQRTGRVFNPANVAGYKGRPRRETVSDTISRIGEKAGVKVNEGKLAGKDHTKYASAHDLRRAFGLRWAMRVMPPVLQQLMRHESIETTMRFYVGRDAETTADLLWSVSGSALSNTPIPTTAATPEQSPQVVEG
jgi:integrase